MDVEFREVLINYSIMCDSMFMWRAFVVFSKGSSYAGRLASLWCWPPSCCWPECRPVCGC